MIGPGRMMVTFDGYRAMTAMVMDAADQLCERRLVVTHIGGYSATFPNTLSDPSGRGLGSKCRLKVRFELSGARLPETGNFD